MYCINIKIYIYILIMKMFFTLVIRNDANMNINEFHYFLPLAYQNLWKCTKLGKMREKDKEENGRGK